MTKNKLIFLIVWGVIIIGLLIASLFMWGNKIKSSTWNVLWDLTIWIIWDSQEGMDSFISDFKLDNKRYTNANIVVQSFNSYEDYNLALTSAMIRWTSPDIFVLNNNEKSVFEDRTTSIPNSVINMRKFREEHKAVFTEDLVLDLWEKDANEIPIRYLKWVPIWYETLGIFFNKRFRISRPDFNTLSAVNNSIIKVQERDGIPLLGMWNGKNVLYAWDILAQFLLLNKINWIKWAKGSDLEQALSAYTLFGSPDWENKYNSLLLDNTNSDKTNLELFIDEKVAAIVAYPRLIEKIQGMGFSKKLLRAVSFPHSYNWDGSSLVNYNYFVMNKDLSKWTQSIALSLLSYMASEKWSKKYLKHYRYYLPARISLEKELEDKPISNYFKNIVLADFYSDSELSSFQKEYKMLYDRWIVNVLDVKSGIKQEFFNFKRKLLCQSEKILTLKNLWTSCE